MKGKTIGVIAAVLALLSGGVAPAQGVAADVREDPIPPAMAAGPAPADESHVEQFTIYFDAPSYSKSPSPAAALTAATAVESADSAAAPRPPVAVSEPRMTL